MESRSQFNRSLAWNVCAAIAVLSLAIPSVVQDAVHHAYGNKSQRAVPMDFPHYYMAGRITRLHAPDNDLYYPPADRAPRTYLDLRFDGSTPYGMSSNRGGLPDGAVIQPFDAPPGSALVMAPFTFLSWKPAYLAWQLSCALMMMASVYLALRLLKKVPPPMVVTAVAFACALLYLPFERALTLGNVDVVVLFLWVVGVFFLSRERTIPSAFCFALGTAVKVSPIFAVPLFVVRRQWKWLAWYGVFGIVVLLASAGAVGWRNYLLWAGKVAPSLSCGIKCFANRSVTGFVYAMVDPNLPYQRTPGPAAWCMFIKALSGICYSAFLFWCWRKRQDAKGLVLELSLLPLVVLLISPITWPQYWVLAVLPFTILWVRSYDPSSGSSWLDFALLSGSLVVLGAKLPEYQFAIAFGQAGRLTAMGGTIAATLALLWVGMRMYGHIIADGDAGIRGSASFPSAD